MFEQWRVDHARDDRVAADALGRVAHGDLARELHQRRFAGRVADMIVPEMAQAADRADIHDRAAALARHRRQQHLGCNEDAGQVEVDLAAEILDRHFDGPAGDRAADIVQQHVDASEAPQRRFRHGGH
jgi:hypothetical protein